MADDQKEAAAAAVVHTPDHESITPPNPLSSFISNFTQLINFRFPPKKLETDTKTAAGNTVFRSGEPAEDSKPATVRFSDARPTTVAPLKLEAEEVEKDTNPVFLWQVYAIGGFFVLRWVLARWNERKANKNKKSSDEEDSPPQPPPAADGDE
ncbi:hypothetical protein HanXRQr2_Chr08g0329161 [Helianthus annuus]|uniref:Transmembrane protein n=1 Tax=Helianthus annuus TaxID=4232 RepID=A0A251U5B4_HELAN|nr:uncharacterized protein LOC110872409 [Helianthus annuus]KAF5794535.1 hypothetical protein HanXRQr2_Chr08g0329161 [Helianthus annuus]